MFYFLFSQYEFLFNFRFKKNLECPGSLVGRMNESVKLLNNNFPILPIFTLMSLLFVTSLYVHIIHILFKVIQ